MLCNDRHRVLFSPVRNINQKHAQHNVPFTLYARAVRASRFFLSDFTMFFVSTPSAARISKCSAGTAPFTFSKLDRSYLYGFSLKSASAVLLIFSCTFSSSVAKTLRASAMASNVRDFPGFRRYVHLLAVSASSLCCSNREKGGEGKRKIKREREKERE